MHAGAGGRGRGKGKVKKKAKKGRGRAGKAGLLFGVEWHRVVLDEAQSIKNAQTLASHASCGLKARMQHALALCPPGFRLPAPNLLPACLCVSVDIHFFRNFFGSFIPSSLMAGACPCLPVTCLPGASPACVRSACTFSIPQCCDSCCWGLGDERSFVAQA